MNEHIIIGMVTPYLQDGKLSYHDFEQLFDMLSLREQYAVIEVLDKNSIELVDSFQTSNGSVNPETDEQSDETDDLDNFEQLYDDSLFSGEDDEDNEEPTDERKPVRSVFLEVRKDIKLSNRALIRMIQDGDEQAKQDLCIKNRGLVEKSANMYFRMLGNKLPIEDLVQCGMMGMIKAAERFNLDKGTEFSTYAVYWIRQVIKREILNCGYTIRIPVHKMDQIQKVMKLDAQFAEETDYKKRMEKISQTSRMPVELIEDCLRIFYQFIGTTSLDAPVGEEGDVSLGEFVSDEEQDSVEDLAIKSEMKREIEAALGGLREREREVLRLRFGFVDGRTRTLEEVGEMYGVTRERIRQIEVKALRKLKYYAKRRNLKDFYE